MPRFKVDTIIGADPTNVKKIGTAQFAYSDGLTAFCFPTDVKLNAHTRLFDNVESLKPYFIKRLLGVSPFVNSVILEINKRAEELKSSQYKKLLKKDLSLWTAKDEEKLKFGMLACVDKGVPYEAVIGIDGQMGRTLAGDLEIFYSPTEDKFVTSASALVKRFIHLGRQGEKLKIEILMEHVSCGRRGQMLANEDGLGGVPSFEGTFENLLALAKGFDGDVAENKLKLKKLKDMWFGLPRQGFGIKAADNGILAGIVTKLAQRQAISDLEQYINVVSPIELYDKHTGSLLTGLQSLNCITSVEVLDQGGFTQQAIDGLTEKQEIFSSKYYFEKGVGEEITKHSRISEGARKFVNLQKQWLLVQSELIDLTETLWSIYKNKKNTNKIVSEMVEHYLKLALRDIKLKQPQDRDIVSRRLIHHLFHSLAYSYLFATFRVGNVPGKHIEDHLVVGDHEFGTRDHLGLGQGDLEQPSALEMYTGYSVLQHSVPGAEGKPVVVMIKLDTDRDSDSPLGTEETNIAINDLGEFFKLWPYMLVGDMIPILAIRSKETGGINRLGLSILLAFGKINRLLDRFEKLLPDFVPASTSSGSVVLVPAVDVLKAGIAAKADLKDFRRRMEEVAASYLNPATQTAFRAKTEI